VTAPRYDLPGEEIRRISARALARHPGTGRFVSIVVGPGDPLAGVGRTLERQVFEESFGNDAAVMAQEYGPYERQSLFFVVLDRRAGVPAGVGRVIQDDGPRVKTIVDAPEHIGVGVDEISAFHGLGEGRVWDFATVAVLPEYRGGRSSLAVSSLLYRTFVVAGRRAGARHAVAMLDRVAWRNIRLVGVPVAQLAGSGPFAYLGSAENRAIHVDFAAIEPAVAKQAAQLRRPGRPIAGTLPGRGLRRLLIRRVAAGVSRGVATGRGLDEHIAFA
jgi:hypothetical protein